MLRLKPGAICRQRIATSSARRGFRPTDVVCCLDRYLTPMRLHSRALPSSNHVFRPVETGLFFQEDGDQSNIRWRNPADASRLTQGCRSDLQELLTRLGSESRNLAIIQLGRKKS